MGVDIGQSIEGFVGQPYLPHALDRWPPVGTRGEFELLLPPSRGQVRLFPISFDWIQPDEAQWQKMKQQIPVGATVTGLIKRSPGRGIRVELPPYEGWMPLGLTEYASMASGRPWYPGGMTKRAIPLELFGTEQSFRVEGHWDLAREFIVSEIEPISFLLPRYRLANPSSADNSPQAAG